MPSSVDGQSIANVQCAKCHVPVECRPDDSSNSIATCPVCGITDTVENAFREAADYKFEQTTESIERQLQDLAGHTKGFQFTPASKEKRVYRFILD